MDRNSQSIGKSLSFVFWTHRTRFSTRRSMLFVASLIPSREVLGLHLKICHDQIFPHLSQFVIHSHVVQRYINQELEKAP